MYVRTYVRTYIYTYTYLCPCTQNALRNFIRFITILYEYNHRCQTVAIASMVMPISHPFQIQSGAYLHEWLTFMDKISRWLEANMLCWNNAIWSLLQTCFGRLCEPVKVPKRCEYISHPQVPLQESQHWIVHILPHPETNAESEFGPARASIYWCPPNVSKKRSAAPSWPVTGMRKNILDAFGQRNGIIGSWPQGSENLVEQHLHLPDPMGTKMARLKHGNGESPSLAKSWMIMNHQGFQNVHQFPSCTISNSQNWRFSKVNPCILSVCAACALVSKRQISKALAPPRKRAAPSMNSFKVICPSPQRSHGRFMTDTSISL